MCACVLLLTCMVMLSALLCQTEAIRRHEREQMARALRDQFWEPIAQQLRAMQQ